MIYLYTSDRYSSVISYRRSCYGSLSKPTACAALSLHEVTIFYIQIIMKVIIRDKIGTYACNSSISDAIQRGKSFRKKKWGAQRSYMLLRQKLENLRQHP